MATALPRPARPTVGPPNVALPALPLGKTRRTGYSNSSHNTNNTTPFADSQPDAFSSDIRAPSKAVLQPAPALIPTTSQQKASLSTYPTPKTLRKSASINSFPQPPRNEHRCSSTPPSPLPAERPRSRKPRSPKDSGPVLYDAMTPSLLNGNGEGKSVLSVRISDGLTSISTPPHSRSSSAQESYSTSATTEDAGDGLHRTESHHGPGEKRASKSEGKGNVLVSLRVRSDANADERSADGEWLVDGRTSLIAYRGREGGDYYYDNVFTTHDNNARVYDHIAKRLVHRVMEGYHGTVFAYGMTGTGKTFSMQGTASSPGVIPLAITDIFSYIRETPSREFLLRVSYLEIYNEKIHDLLSMPTSAGVGGAAQQDEIKLREDSKRGVYAMPLKEEIVQSPTQLLRVIARGDQARRTASTQFNARSSRSHAVVQIVVESRERISRAAPAGTDSKRRAIPPGGVRVSTLSLIDLAGSEKAAESRERRQEGAHINKSLLTLGTVIAKLSEWKDIEGKSNDKDGKHLPYRDSELTRLLQGALSGNSLISILCTIQIGAAGVGAAAHSHITETLNTLKFASRAKNNIVSHAKRAEEALGAGGDGGARVLERYRMEILELRQQLELQARTREAARELADEAAERVREQEATERHEEQILEMQLARTALKERIDHLNRLILSSKSIGVNSNDSMSSLGQCARFSQYSQYSQYSLSGSVRSSIATSSNGIRPVLGRTASMTSASSTVGRQSSFGCRVVSEEAVPEGGSDTVGEYGDGRASLTAQNRALQADLADKNRYIATLEKRLLQARRASSSRTSLALTGSSKSIMVGEDHSVSAALRDKNAEINELRVRLDDKDRMLAALRGAVRSRDPVDASSGPPQPPASLETRRSARTKKSPSSKTKSVDEMNRMLEEMLQEGVDTGHAIRGVHGSVRLPARPKPGLLAEPPRDLEPLRQSPVPREDAKPMSPDVACLG